MKLSCTWCCYIYTPAHPEAVRDPLYGRNFCSIGCRDADALFKERVKDMFPHLKDYNSKRLLR